MQSQDTLPPFDDLDPGGKNAEVAVDSRNAADIQVVMANNDLEVDIQVVCCQNHGVVEPVFADTIGHRQDSVSGTMWL